MSLELIYGVHTVRQKINTKPYSVKKVYYLESKKISKISELLDLSLQNNISIESLDKKKFIFHLHSHNLSHSVVHQGIIAECKNSLEIFDDKFLKKEFFRRKKSKSLILIIDQISDPHNLGVCIRNAVAFNVDYIIFPKNNSCNFNSTVQKVSSGSSEHATLICVKNIVRTIKYLKSQGVWTIGLCGKSLTILSSIDLDLPIAIVLGSEGSGLRRQTREECDYLSKIAINDSLVSSLNLSVASGIALYEVASQRILKGS